jgi:hypothetical protein
MAFEEMESVEGLMKTIDALRAMEHSSERYIEKLQDERAKYWDRVVELEKAIRETLSRYRQLGEKDLDLTMTPILHALNKEKSDAG